MENRYYTPTIEEFHVGFVFEIHKDELEIVPQLKSIMENIFPAKRLPLTCGVDHSWTSWADKVEGLPVYLEHGKETRNKI